MPYRHYIDVSVTPESPVVAPQINASPIAIIATSSNSTLFTENVAVEIPDFTDDTEAKCGAQGTLKSVFNTLRSMDYLPKAVVVNVPEGADDAETAANVIAGLEILKQSSTNFDFEIKLVAAPGLELSEDVINAIADTGKEINAYPMMGMTYVLDDALSDAENVDAAIAERAKFTFDGELLFPPTVPYGDSVSYIAALAVIHRVVIDEVVGPQRVSSNYLIKGGIDALSMPMGYQSEQAPGNKLNAAEITTLVSIGKNKYSFHGCRTVSDVEEFKFQNGARAALILNSNLKAFFERYRDEITSTDDLHLAEENAKTEVYDPLVDADIFVNYDFEIDTVKTTRESMQDGRIYFKSRFGTPPPMEQIKINNTPTSEYLPDVLTQNQ